MNKRILQEFFAGVIGAMVLAAIMYSLQAANLSGTPGFVNIYRTVAGASDSLTAHILGALGFVVAGGLWAVLFVSIVRKPTVWKGMLFGFVPTLFLWFVLAPVTGQPIFNGFTTRGILFPILYNVIIWGAIVGFLSRKWGLVR